MNNLSRKQIGFCLYCWLFPFLSLILYSLNILYFFCWLILLDFKQIWCSYYWNILTLLLYFSSSSWVYFSCKWVSYQILVVNSSLYFYMLLCNCNVLGGWASKTVFPETICIFYDLSRYYFYLFICFSFSFCSASIK